MFSGTRVRPGPGSPGSGVDILLGIPGNRMASLGCLKGQEGFVQVFPRMERPGFASRVWMQAGKPEQARITEQGPPKPSPSTRPNDSGTTGGTHMDGFCSPVLMGARPPARQSVSPAVDWRDLLVHHPGQMLACKWTMHGSWCVHAGAGVNGGSVTRKGVKMS